MSDRTQQTPAEGSSPPHRRVWLVRSVQVLILALVVYFIWRAVTTSLDEIHLRGSLAKVRWTWLILAGLIYVIALVPAVWFWRHVLGLLGEQPGWFVAAVAYYVGNLGKYVPGKAMVVILRVALLRSRRLTARSAAASVFYETLTMMAVGGFLGAGLVAILYRDHWLYVLLAVGMSLASLVPTLPPVFAWLTRKLGAAAVDESGISNEAIEHAVNIPAETEREAKASRHPPNAALRRLGAGAMLTGWASHLLGWAILGCSLWSVCRGLGLDATPDFSSWFAQWAVCTAAASLAMVAGFLSFIPAGALVRESMILAALAPAFGTSQALLAAVCLRLVWLAGELLISGVLYATVKWRRTVVRPDE